MSDFEKIHLSLKMCSYFTAAGATLDEMKVLAHEVSLGWPFHVAILKVIRGESEICYAGANKDLEDYYRLKAEIALQTRKDLTIKEVFTWECCQALGLNKGTLTRVLHCMRNDDIETLAQLVRCREDKLLRTPNMSRRSVHLIKEVLGSMNLHLGMYQEDDR